MCSSICKVQIFADHQTPFYHNREVTGIKLRNYARSREASVIKLPSNDVVKTIGNAWYVISRRYVILLIIVSNITSEASYRADTVRKRVCKRVKHHQLCDTERRLPCRSR